MIFSLKTSILEPFTLQALAYAQVTPEGAEPHLADKVFRLHLPRKGIPIGHTSK